MHEAYYFNLYPNNYITFNGEDWRIIGIFGDKVKIVRNSSIGTYSWDNGHDTYGRNDWTAPATLQTNLKTADADLCGHR